MNLPTIICAKCGRPVDRVTMGFNAFLNRQVIIAECHGAREESTVDFREFSPDQIVSATAFLPAGSAMIGYTVPEAPCENRS